MPRSQYPHIQQAFLHWKKAYGHLIAAESQLFKAQKKQKELWERLLEAKRLYPEEEARREADLQTKARQRPKKSRPKKKRSTAKLPDEEWSDA